MKYLFHAVIALVSVLALHAAEHPFDEASTKLKEAQAQYEVAEKGFLRAVESIRHSEKQKAMLKAFTERKALCKGMSELEAELKTAASPAPDTSTSSSLTPYWIEIRHLKFMASQLNDETDWILKNWKLDPR